MTTAAHDKSTNPSVNTAADTDAAEGRPLPPAHHRDRL